MNQAADEFYWNGWEKEYVLELPSQHVSGRMEQGKRIPMLQSEVDAYISKIQAGEVYEKYGWSIHPPAGWTVPFHTMEPEDGGLMPGDEDDGMDHEENNNETNESSLEGDD